jgi:hypothetical protein
MRTGTMLRLVPTLTMTLDLQSQSTEAALTIYMIWMARKMKLYDLQTDERIRSNLSRTEIFTCPSSFHKSGDVNREVFMEHDRHALKDTKRFPRKDGAASSPGGDFTGKATKSY